MSKGDLKKAFTVPREADVIAKEYSELCTMAGDKGYRMDVLKAEIQQLNQKLFELNQEHTASRAYYAPRTEPVEPKEAPAEAPAV